MLFSFTLLVLSSHAAAGQPVPPGPCYLVADNDGIALEDAFTRWTAGDTQEVLIGFTETALIEAIALDPHRSVLVAADGERFGWIDLNTGLFTEVGRFGTGQGALGRKTINDVDGLAFAPDGTLYGIERRTEEDLLFQINPQTGTVVSDAFGDGIAYLVVTPTADRTNIDDLAFSADGTLYALQVGSDPEAHLVTINLSTGATVDLGPLGIDHVEGLTVDAAGRLFGSLGSDGKQLVYIDPATGSASSVAPLGIEGFRDYEAVDCRAPGTNTVLGHVYRGISGPSVKNIANVRLVLYHDANANGIVDADDAPIATSRTDTNGRYRFAVHAAGAFVVELDETTLPADDAISSPTIEVSFPGLDTTITAAPFEVRTTVSTSMDEQKAGAADLPAQPTLAPNYPNPFNPQTTLTFTLPHAEPVRLSVASAQGQNVVVLVEGFLSAGTHNVAFDASRFPSGPYLYRLQTPSYSTSRMMLLVK